MADQSTPPAVLANNKGGAKVSKIRDDGRTEEERHDLAEDLLENNPAPWDMIADPPLSLTYMLRRFENKQTLKNICDHN